MKKGSARTGKRIKTAKTASLAGSVRSSSRRRLASKATSRGRPTRAPASKSRPAAGRRAKAPAAAPARFPLVIPPILLEGDPPVSAPKTSAPEPSLPESYGTGQLRLMSRDPHWLYAHWDFSPQQQQQFNARSADRHLVIQVYRNAMAGQPLSEAHVNPESKHWFIHVPEADARYQADLGYYAQDRHWVSLAVSNPALTPTEALAADKSVQFATIPLEAPLPSRMLPPPPSASPALAAGPSAKTAARPALPRPGGSVPASLAPPAAAFYAQAPESQKGLLPERPGSVSRQTAVATAAKRASALTGQAPVATAAGGLQPPWLPEALAGLQLEGLTVPPFLLEGEEPLLLTGPSAPMAEWTPAQEMILAEMSGVAEMRQEWVDSAGVAELVKRQAQAAGQPAPSGAVPVAPGGVSSPLGGEMAAAPGFWLSVNAELIIYGATSPDARVTIGGRPIQLRPDGSFSYRFALPDGHYELPIRAESPQGESRQAKLEFYRGTEYHGEVGAHPQDAALKPPAPENAR